MLGISRWDGVGADSVPWTCPHGVGSGEHDNFPLKAPITFCCSFPTERCSSSKRVPSLKLTVRTWKLMVGRLLSFWEGLFSGAMLVLGRVDHGWNTDFGPCMAHEKKNATAAPMDVWKYVIDLCESQHRRCGRDLVLVFPNLPSSSQWCTLLATPKTTSGSILPHNTHPAPHANLKSVWDFHQRP